MKIRTIICTVIALFLPVELSAFDAATHWHIGLTTTDVWLDYDAAFCNPSFYHKAYMQFYGLNLQLFQHLYMKHFSDAQYFAQHSSSVEIQEKLCKNN